MSNNFKYTKTRHTWVIEIQCVPCSTLSTAAEAIQSQQSVSAAVEGEGDALLLQTQSSNPTFLPEVLGHYRSEHQLLQTLLWRQILHHHGLIVRFSTHSIYLLQGFLATELYIYSLLQWFQNIIKLLVEKIQELRSQNICATFLLCVPVIRLIFQAWYWCPSPCEIPQSIAWQLPNPHCAPQSFHGS